MTQTPPALHQKIAIIGSGIAGLGAAYALYKNHDITVYEATDYAGGHSNTVDIHVNGQPVAVDTGFIVYNERNYPNLTNLFSILDVPTAPSNMTFAMSVDNGALEYSGSGLAGFFAQKQNFISPGHWRLLGDILRFFRQAQNYLKQEPDINITLGDYLDENTYSKQFIRHHILPMGGAIWSMSPRDMMAFPAITFMRFFENHGLLSLTNRPQWHTVKGGSREYIKRLTAPFANSILLKTPVKKIEKTTEGLMVHTPSGRSVFDHVICATHGDQALSLLPQHTSSVKKTLQTFRYSKNTAYLHTDASLMPQRRKAWSSWNYLSDTTQEHMPVSVTYWMNNLQPLPTGTNIFVTLNPLQMPAQETIHGTFHYEHPLFTQKTLRAQQKLQQIQGLDNIWFCGSYCGYGFHEDALTAGLSVATRINNLASGTMAA